MVFFLPEIVNQPWHSTILISPLQEQRRNVLLASRLTPKLRTTSSTLMTSHLNVPKLASCVSFFSGSTTSFVAGTSRFPEAKMFSSSCFFERDVPQGSILSSASFYIFMSDFFEALPPHVKRLAYADHALIYCSNAFLWKCKDLLQQALRFNSQWCTYWKLQIRLDECHAINLSRSFGDSENNLFIKSGMIDGFKAWNSWSSTLFEKLASEDTLIISHAEHLKKLT